METVGAIGSSRSELKAPVTTSISHPCRTALVVHVENRDARRRFRVGAFPQSRHQRSNSLAMVQLASSVFVEASSITVSC
jgi:hypothetical protein